MKPSLVRCKEGQDEVFDNCVKDESLSDEEKEQQETTVDQDHITNDQKGDFSAKELGSAAMDFSA